MAESFDNLKNQLAGLQKKYLESETLTHDLKKRLLELNSLYLISLTLSKTLDLNEILKSFKSLFQKKIKVDHFGIFLLDESMSILTLYTSFGLPKNVDLQSSFKFGEDIFGKALEIEEIVYIPNIAREQEFQFFGGDPKTGSFVVVPILLRKNHPIGVLSLYRNKINAFSKEERVLFKKISLEIAKVLDKSLLFQHTKELSITDDLTGLYNRRYFNQRFEREVQRAKRYRRPLSILMVDIDYFKNYNDINGHLLGDEVLKKVAILLESNLRKADIVARYGGEEFVILLPEINKSHADQVAEKLRRTIELKHFPKEQYQPNKNLTISIGLATLPDHSINSRELIEFADRALYRAKAEGRNRVIAYHSSMIQISQTNILHMEPKSAAAGE
ncbi:MAG: sensor domain-containing diguanylate cyclase [bacterium]|nr:MAG: sensor domain-containing diguanylate cyclase [bacterium]